jgi:hypothetical protein
MGGPSGSGLPVFHKVGLPVPYRDHVTLQWHRAGDNWRLTCSGKPVADVVPDERYPGMYRAQGTGEKKPARDGAKSFSL